MAQPFAPDLRHPPVVLAGTSLGPESDAVVSAALQLARAGRGRVYLLHVLEPPPVPGGAAGFLLSEQHLAERAHTALRVQLARVGVTSEEIAGLDAEVGAAGPTLHAVADRLNADVIVVGTAVAAPLPMHRVGSTTRHLLREGGRPVLVVKGNPRIPPVRVLAPLDFSLLAADSLRCGLAFLAGVSSERLPEVVALHAIDERGEEPPKHAREAMTLFLGEHTLDYGGPIRSEVRQGDAVLEILAAGEREQPDLVLLGTHGRSGWQRLRLGSVAEAIVASAPSSVLVVPPAAALASVFAEAIGEGIRSTR